MKRENADVARHELIGLFVTIESAHAGWNGLEGTVVDETKHTLLVELDPGSEIRVPKTGNRFVFRVGNERFVVNGDDITFRPEDRTKKVRM
ncbi:MAG TPA: ribonuclease P protein subunit [Candidatus Thermoplasmatota archaeon]|nr:ribonuclease P protein subunit [Candidatus Thermoplasmatota archaeon]